MSSATPAAFLSAMSITTTSASCLSAMPRATVAPTLPAPPTTVTFRFIDRSWSSHIPDDGIPELGRLQLRGALHLARQVVGDLLLGDRLLEAAFDEGRCLGPPEVVEHHDARQNHRSRVDDVFARVLRGRAVRRLEERDLVAHVRARRHP